MRAVTVVPQTSGTVSLSEVPEPDEREGSVLVDVIRVGVCGTDVEILAGKYGEPPPGRELGRSGCSPQAFERGRDDVKVVLEIHDR